MAPTIVIVGATGNTGRSVVETLPKLLQSTELVSYRVLALTRSANSEAAKELARLPGVELAEQDWVEIDDHWLLRHEVARVFIASHNLPNQFAEEGQFLVNCLRAKVRYVVRISTRAANIRPDFPAYYPRTHWAIENMLSQPEFQDIHWSSLQPNGFLPMILTPAANLIEEFRKNGKQKPLRIMIDASTPTGLIDPHDVGIVAAHLLAQEMTALHNRRRYVLNGPEDVTGEQIVKLVEQHIGEPVKDVRFKDLSMIDQMVDHTTESKNVIGSIKSAPTTSWAGEAKANTASKETLELYAPKRTASEVLKQLLGI
ncbi:hypothetical protein LTS10_012161 [Elasticomyces elasticus]|nr:hypothetical protein LTS10_012161 [Elasticomyces elasticus]